MSHLRSLLWSPDLWFYGPRIRRCVDLRPNKDAAWKLCEIGDVQDCEKTLAVHVHETGLMENRVEVTRNRSSPSKLSQAKLSPAKEKGTVFRLLPCRSPPMGPFRRCRMDRRAVTLHEIRRLRKVRPHMLYLIGDSAHRIVLNRETPHVSPTL